MCLASEWSLEPRRGFFSAGRCCPHSAPAETPPCSIRLLVLGSSGSKGLGPCLLWSTGYAHMDSGHRRRDLATPPPLLSTLPWLAVPTHGNRIPPVRDSRSPMLGSQPASAATSLLGLLWDRVRESHCSFVFHLCALLCLIPLCGSPYFALLTPPNLCSPWSCCPSFIMFRSCPYRQRRARPVLCISGRRKEGSSVGSLPARGTASDWMCESRAALWS